jgi:N4-gp56 family major capsid protein
MAITTLSQLPPEVRTYFDRLLLALARPYFIYDLFAQKRQIPLNSGDQMVFRRYGTLKNVGVGKSLVIDLELQAA